MNKVIGIVAVLIGVASTGFAAVNFAESTERYWISTSSDEIDEAEANYELNSGNTDNVYQQIVVAGWGTREMTKAVANQTAAMRDGMELLVIEQKRTSQLMASLVALMGVIITILAFGFMSQPRRASASGSATGSASKPRNKSVLKEEVKDYLGL